MQAASMLAALQPYIMYRCIEVHAELTYHRLEGPHEKEDVC